MRYTYCRKARPRDGLSLSDMRRKVFPDSVRWVMGLSSVGSVVRKADPGTVTQTEAVPFPIVKRSEKSTFGVPEENTYPLRSLSNVGDPISGRMGSSISFVNRIPYSS